MIVHDLFRVGEPLLEKTVRTIAVYVGIVVLLRVAGKRDLAQLNSFDLVVLLLLSNVVQNAVIGNDNSLAGGLLGATVLVAANGAVVRSARLSPRAFALFEGTPTTLVADGALREATVRRLGLREADVVTALRRQGASTMAQVRQATLEPGGSIVVELEAEAENATAADIARLEAKLDRLLDRSR